MNRWGAWGAAVVAVAVTVWSGIALGIDPMALVRNVARVQRLEHGAHVVVTATTPAAAGTHGGDEEQDSEQGEASQTCHGLPPGRNAGKGSA